MIVPTYKKTLDSLSYKSCSSFEENSYNKDYYMFGDMDITERPKEFRDLSHRAYTFNLYEYHFRGPRIFSWISEPKNRPFISKSELTFINRDENRYNNPVDVVDRSADILINRILNII